MIRLSVLYPKTEGATFDHDYYRDSHVPLVVKTWEPLSAEVDKGVSGPYEAAVHLTFADQAALDAALAHEGREALRADLVNYTTIVPVMQVSEVFPSG